MLEKSYTIPVMFGIFLGLIMAGVQVSAGALNAAVGQRQEIALVVVENTGRDRVDLQALGKRLSISLSMPAGPGELAGQASERAEGLFGQCRERAGKACQELAGLVKSGLESAGECCRRWKDLFFKNGSLPPPGS